MTLRITETVEHATTPEAAFTMVCDRDYQALRCERSGALSHEVAIELEGEATTIVTRREMSSARLPDYVRGLVGSSVNIVESTRWGLAGDDGSREGALTIQIPGTPVSFTGGVHLSAGGAGTVHRVDGSLSAHVPLLGGRIEKAVAPMVTDVVRLEESVAQEWLQGG